MSDNKKFIKNDSEVKPRGFILFLIILGIIVIFVTFSNYMGTQKERLTLNEFRQILDEPPGQLENVVYKEGKGFTFTKKGDAKGKVYFVKVLETTEDTLISELLIKSNAELDGKNRLVSELLPHLLILGTVFFIIYFFFFRKIGQRGDGFMSFGKSKARFITPELCDTTFNDVAGINEAVEEVKEVVDFLKRPEAFDKLGGRLPRGVLIVGPPGVGKTLLAKAIAGEAEVPFLSISGSDFVELFVGVGASRVRDLFQKAKDNAPSIIFLDEIDAIGRRRGAGLGGGHDEREQTLNAILVEMDGFDRHSNVIIIAATNREDILDPALLRPGRFDRQIFVDLPDIKGREAILKVHARKIVMSDQVDLKIIARSTPMASGADLENILNEAALIAAMDGKTEVDSDAIEKAREKMLWGKEKKSRIMSEDDRRITALHECGHAICAKVLPEVDPLHKVSIIPRGTSLGMTMMLPERDEYAIGRKKFLGQVVVLLAGRAAEKLYANDITSGAADDLERATRLVRKMVCEWGMSDELGIISYHSNVDHVFLGNEITREQRHSEHTLKRIDDELESIIKVSFERAETILKGNKKAVSKIVEALLELETLDADQVDKLLKGGEVIEVKGRKEDTEEGEDRRHDTGREKKERKLSSKRSRKKSASKEQPR